MKRLLTGAGRLLYAKLQGGDTLIEVIVAMLLVGIMILGLVPLFIKIHTYELMNTARVVAYSLAERQIEAAKSTPYAYLGTQTGDPPGNFPQVQTNLSFQDTPGITYTILTQIRYKEDPSRTSTDPTTVDYKDITVEVKALPANQVGNSSSIDYTPAAFYPDITMNTRATSEDQWGELPGGNIQVDAVDSLGNPVPNMTVYLTGSAGTSYQMVTDTASGDLPGGILFANLPAGTYTMTATDTPGVGPATWMVAPGVATYVGGGTVPSGPGQAISITSYEPPQIMKFQAAPVCTLIITFDRILTSADTITLADFGKGLTYSAKGNGTAQVTMQPIFPDNAYILTVDSDSPYGYQVNVSQNTNPNVLLLSTYP
jgi:type II secretory pathway pseudopilin PulG